MAEGLSEKVSALLLPVVHNPAQYIGGEVNEVRKESAGVEVSVALAFPDTYAVGMSNLGLAILYEAVNRLPWAAAERVYCPWTDAVELMRRQGIPLFSWESRRAVREFNVVGVTLQHELSYSNVLLLLDLAGITLHAEARRDAEPLVIAGGPLADCCEPLADFLDLVLLGEGEEAFPAVLAAYRELRPKRLSRRALLLELACRFPFLYVPRFYQSHYHADGTLAACSPTEPDVPAVISRAYVKDLDAAAYPTAPLVPHTAAVHDRIAIEIMRGCPQRCAFCHAGHTRGPVRTRSLDRIVEIAWQSYLATGHDTVSLLSLSSSDYPGLGELVRRLYARFEGRHVGISLPSLRVDRQLRDVPPQIAGVRREGLTVAVEAAGDRLRQAIGKRVTDADLLATLRAAYEAGWHTVKLYFIVGFPGETDADIDAIAELAGQVSVLRREVGGGPATVNVTVSWLVPKPHTPLAWAPMQTEDYFRGARRRLLAAARVHGKLPVRYKFHNLGRSLLEGVFARGDRRLGRVLETAYRQGACFDAWDECFRHDLYLDAFRQGGLDPAFYAHRPRGENEVLSWDHLAGQDRDQLYRRYQRLIEMLAGSS